MKRLLALLAFLLTFLAAAQARATPEFAEQSGQACGMCHRDPVGGGSLTDMGEQFVAGGHRWPIPGGVTTGAGRASLRFFRTALGFLHLATAVMWFGTIFYVHIVLRPKYALGGLPRAELQLAWICMFLLAATGVPLTYLRFHSPANLLGSHSGRLLLVKIGLFLFLVVSAAFVTLFLGPRLRRARGSWQDNDGREGRPAWVKVGERTYDVTASPRWKDGSHFRRHQAGQDLTEDLSGAPHGPEKLEGFPSFDAQGEASAPPAVRVFYAMAYLNLFVALGVLLVIAAWRWG